MTFKVGDKVRLAPFVTDEMLESIYIESDEEKDQARADSVVESVDCDASFDGRICDVALGDFYVPSAWLVRADKPAPLDASALRRIIGELDVSLGPGLDAALAEARAYLRIVVNRMERGAKDKR